MGRAKRIIQEPIIEDEGCSLAAAMRRLEALTQDSGESPPKDGPSPTVEEALRLLGIELPKDKP
jgi:hypothetical protein